MTYRLCGYANERGKDLAIPTTARHMLETMARLAGNERRPEYFGSWATLVKESGISRATVARLVKLLEDRKLIVRDGTKGQKIRWRLTCLDNESLNRSHRKTKPVSARDQTSLSTRLVIESPEESPEDDTKDDGATRSTRAERSSRAPLTTEDIPEAVLREVMSKLAMDQASASAWSMAKLAAASEPVKRVGPYLRKCLASAPESHGERSEPSGGTTEPDPLGWLRDLEVEYVEPEDMTPEEIEAA